MTDLNFEVLKWGLGEVIEPIPPAKRSQYKYFRGAHLGALGLAISLHSPSLALPGDYNKVPAVHVTQNYYLALQHAINLASGADNLQLDEAGRQVLGQMAEAELPSIMPAIVYGLRPEAVHNLRPAPPTHMGNILEHPTLDMLDPYSAEALHTLLDVPADSWTRPAFITC